MCEEETQALQSSGRVGWDERQECAAAILWWVVTANDHRPVAAVVTLK